MKDRIVYFSLCLIFSIATVSVSAEERERQLPNLWTYHWELDETPEGQESATPVEPVEVTFLFGHDLKRLYCTRTIQKP